MGDNLALAHQKQLYQDGLDHLYRGAGERSQGRKSTPRLLIKCMCTVRPFSQRFCNGTFAALWPRMGNQAPRTNRSSRIRTSMDPAPRTNRRLIQDGLEHLRRGAGVRSQGRKSTPRLHIKCMGTVRPPTRPSRARAPSPLEEEMGKGSGIRCMGVAAFNRPTPNMQSDKTELQVVQAGFKKTNRNHFQGSNTNGPDCCRPIRNQSDAGQRLRRLTNRSPTPSNYEGRADQQDINPADVASRKSTNPNTRRRF